MISFVIPVFKSKEKLGGLLEEIECWSKSESLEHEIILVEDSDCYTTWLEVKALCTEHENRKGIRLTRNYGQNNATLCGISHAKGDYIVTMDDDGQHPPKEVSALLIELIDNRRDVVYGLSKNRSTSWTRRLLTNACKAILEKGLKARGAMSFSAFRIMTRDIAKMITDIDVNNSNIDVLISYLTMSVGVVRVEMRRRTEGESGYNVFGLVRIAFDIGTSYSSLPLRLATIVGLSFSMVGLGVFVYVVASWMTVGSSVPGFTFIAGLVAMFGGLNMLSLGVIGEYLGRIHKRSMKIPQYGIRESINMKK